MRSWSTMLVWGLAACGSVGEKPDAGAPPDAGHRDSGSPGTGVCDPAGKFDAPVAISELNTDGVEYSPRLTADELEIYFAAVPSGGGVFTLYRALRSSRQERFGAPVALTGLHTAAGELDPAVSSDGLTLFYRSRGTDKADRLYIATRGSRIGEFASASKIANIAAPVDTEGDFQPFVTADGQELWFSSNRDGGLGSNDIYRATLSGSSFGNVAAVKELNTRDSEEHAALSADKLTVYLSSTRPNSQGGLDIWSAHRSTVNDGFPPPGPVAELSSKNTEYVGWISADNCRLYFSSDRDKSFDLYVATRHPM